MKWFEGVDEVAVPDQWEEIVERSRRSDVTVLEGARSPRARRWLLVGAAAVLVALALGVPPVVTDDDDSSQVVSGEVSTTTVDADSAPLLVCPDGGLIAPDVPPGSDDSPQLLAEVGERRRHTWTEGDLQFDLVMPGLDYIDFVGERVKSVEQPDGLVRYQDDVTHFLGETGLFGPCESFELVVGGGDEQVREHALLDVVSGFEFDPSLGVTDCGETTGPALALAEGPNAMVAVRDIEALGIELWPRGWLGSLPSITKRADGRCEVDVASRGGLRPRATISGRDGRYALEALRGFAPNGVDGDASTIQMDVPASVQITGTEFSVFVDYWCDDCSEASLTIHYPDDDITATAKVTGPGMFTGTLPRPSTPGGYGSIAITWSDSASDGRGIWTTSVESGDFAAS